MKKFFPELLDAFCGELFVRKVLMKYHYGEAQMSELQGVAGEMLPLMRREAFWEVCAPWIWEEKKDIIYEGVLMSLGEGLDHLQDRYQENGRLTEGYMLEVLAEELLRQAYRAYNRQVREEGNRYVVRYRFPGSDRKLPLEMLPDMLNRFSGQVSCNEAFCILPKKSVIFLAELTQDENAECEEICVGCGNRHCPDRVDRGSALTISCGRSGTCTAQLFPCDSAQQKNPW